MCLEAQGESDAPGGPLPVKGMARGITAASCCIPSSSQSLGGAVRKREERRQPLGWHALSFFPPRPASTMPAGTL